MIEKNNKETKQKIRKGLKGDCYDQTTINVEKHKITNKYDLTDLEKSISHLMMLRFNPSLYIVNQTHHNGTRLYFI